LKEKEFNTKKASGAERENNAEEKKIEIREGRRERKRMSRRWEGKQIKKGKKSARKRMREGLEQ
jgi:hypothetical protein